MQGDRRQEQRRQASEYREELDERRDSLDRRKQQRPRGAGVRPDGLPERRGVAFVTFGDPGFRVTRVRVDVTDALDVDLTPTYVLPLETSEEALLIVGVPHFSADFAYIDSTVLRKVGGSVLMPRLTPDQVIATLGRDDPERVFVAAETSLRRGSLVSPRWRRRTTAERRKLSPRRFRPVSHVDVSLHSAFGHLPLVSLSVHLPALASARCALVGVSIDFSSLTKRFEQEGQAELNKGPLKNEEKALIFERARNLREIVAGHRSQALALVTDLRSRTDKSAKALKGELSAGAGYDARRALKVLARRNHRLISDIRSRLEKLQPPEVTEQSDATVGDEIVDYAEHLKDILKPGLSLALPVRFTTGEDIARTVRPTIGEDVRPYSRYERLLIPFTTEREPGSQGLRSAASLLVLGVLMMLVAGCDPSWIPRAMRASGLDEKLFRPPAAGAGEGVREALVAVLVIFPAALYGQYFQTRPRTDIGNSSQLSSFALHSFLFTLPTIPAILAATGRDMTLVSVTSFSVATIALVAGCRVLRTYSGMRLEGLRYLELREPVERPWVDTAARAFFGTVFAVAAWVCFDGIESGSPRRATVALAIAGLLFVARPWITRLARFVRESLRPTPGLSHHPATGGYREREEGGR